ncbi:MAG: phosphotransferase family protein [Ilumatobacter coccineus]|uniref:Phosphotransferase family protein n=1 Tax=Ilumatobacter coccineus TaxID=467094 RepID=A0A2G6KBB2_9ACTN|nr:MAG: phosphotransferase family protein [Ilumatobacter coccineus]
MGTHDEIPGIDPVALGNWLTEHIDGAVGPFEYRQLTGGRSNLTYRIRAADGRQLVVRRPPLGKVLATAHDMAREHRIITAIAQTPVPVPTPLGLCNDETVIGAPFYVMDFVDGVVLDSPAAADRLAEPLRRLASDHLIDILADLHAADLDEIGLGDLARRDGYIERQIKRWSAQWDRSHTRELPEIEEVARRLAANVPTQIGVAVAHGDYRFGNCLVDTATGRVAAILDWELCTLGDPLADLGYLGVYWAPPESVDAISDPTRASGFPTFDEVVERYAVKTGRDVSRIDYYVAFSAFRLAVISEGVLARYLHGVMGSDADSVDLAQFREGTEALAEWALDLLS